MKATMTWRCKTTYVFLVFQKQYLNVFLNDVIIMANVIPPDHVDDLPLVEQNQPDIVPAIPEPVLVDEDEDPEEEEFKEEEKP
ncbi:hypothetical protein Tco_0374607 [Tanacetum coccineum]